MNCTHGMVPHTCTQCRDEKMRANHDRFRDALKSIGRNVCGTEPLAAAYARGVLTESTQDPPEPKKEAR